MPPINICDKDAAPCVTYDATGDAGLSNTPKAFPDALPHTNTSEAVSNLLTLLKKNPTPRSVMIVGHGDLGSIRTGVGSSISFSNNDWVAPFKNNLTSQNLTEIIFCSCSTGFGELGQRLLDRVVQEVNVKKASAFTAALYIDSHGVECDPGKWVTRPPGVLLAPLPVVPHPFFLKGMLTEFRLFHQDEYETIAADHVTSIAYYRADAQGRGPLIILTQGSQTEKLLGLINFNTYFEHEGEPLAAVTGAIEIEFLVDGKREQKAFTVYGNTLLRDQTHPTTFYYVSPNLACALWDFIPLRP